MNTRWGLLGLKVTKISLRITIESYFRDLKGLKVLIIFDKLHNNRHCVHERFSFLTPVLSSQNIIMY